VSQCCIMNLLKKFQEMSVSASLFAELRSNDKSRGACLLLLLIPLRGFSVPDNTKVSASHVDRHRCFSYQYRNHEERGVVKSIERNPPCQI